MFFAICRGAGVFGASLLRRTYTHRTARSVCVCSSDRIRKKDPMTPAWRRKVFDSNNLRAGVLKSRPLHPCTRPRRARKIGMLRTTGTTVTTADSSPANEKRPVEPGRTKKDARRRPRSPGLLIDPHAANSRATAVGLHPLPRRVSSPRPVNSCAISWSVRPA